MPIGFQGNLKMIEIYLSKKSSIFAEIYSGDIKNFVNEILKKVLEKNKNKLKKIFQQKKIIKEFSKDNEIKHIKSFLKYFN